MIEVKNVSKTIKGHPVLQDVSCNFESGAVYGIYGRNGSGKTMLMRCILGLIFSDSGTINVDGKIIGKDIDFPVNVGAIIENPSFFSYATGYENLKLLADIRKVISEEAIRTAIRRVGLDDTDKRAVSKYSLGMKQRLGIAQAVMESPDILVLDEPTNALDEEGINLFYDIIQQEKERGALVIMASHNKDDIETLADVKIKMSDGKIKEVMPANSNQMEEEV